LYIGLDAMPKTTVSLLIQMLEGSENPIVETFKEKEFIEWHILSNNKWVDLSDDMLQNETRRFLESGIVKFKIPRDINTSHTRFTDGLIWIRAKSKEVMMPYVKSRESIPRLFWQLSRIRTMICLI
jgi:hypothetical protein